MRYKPFFYALAFFTLTANAIATPNYGISFHTPLISSEPENVHGAQVMVNYDPDRYHWRKFNLYFDGGLSYFKSSTASQHKTIVIASAAPVIRYTFNRKRYFHPFLELSIGLAYLNKTRFDQRNLGMHVSLQDRFAVGSFFGDQDQWLVSLGALHYSNAHLSDNNGGITFPLMLNIGYRFL